jgi:competence protein ComEA
LGLLGWHVWEGQRRACRPATLERGARIDLNRADHAQLLQLPGLGETLAKRIEDYRRDHGGFRSVDELRRVSGIGPTLLERLRPLVDVEPPAVEEATSEEPHSEVAAPAAGEGKKESSGRRVDVNSAGAAELRTLPGVGPKMAQAILEARAVRPFRSVDDLRRVHGIGPKTLERLRPHVTVGSPPQGGQKDN